LKIGNHREKFLILQKGEKERPIKAESPSLYDGGKGVPWERPPKMPAAVLEIGCALLSNAGTALGRKVLAGSERKNLKTTGKKKKKVFPHRSFS